MNGNEHIAMALNALSRRKCGQDFDVVDVGNVFKYSHDIMSKLSTENVTAPSNWNADQNEFNIVVHLRRFIRMLSVEDIPVIHAITAYSLSELIELEKPVQQSVVPTKTASNATT